MDKNQYKAIPGRFFDSESNRAFYGFKLLGYSPSFLVKVKNKKLGEIYKFINPGRLAFDPFDFPEVLLSGVASYSKALSTDNSNVIRDATFITNNWDKYLNRAKNVKEN